MTIQYYKSFIASNATANVMSSSIRNNRKKCQCLKTGEKWTAEEETSRNPHLIFGAINSRTTT